MADTTSSTERDNARPDPGAAPAASRRRVPAWARVFVFGYLTAFLICGVFVIEAWPLTGFRLFSHLRYPRLLGWQATTVDRSGRETIIYFGAFPRTYRHLPLIMRTYGTLPQRRQEAICQAWAAEVRRHGREVTGVRIYRTVVDLRRHRNRRHRPPARRLLRFTCADGRGARAAA
jgi:hypothetical protein